MHSVRSLIECRFESYSGSHFYGNENRVCSGCRAGSPFRPSLFISQLFYPATYKLTCFDHHSILTSVNPPGFPLGRVECILSGQQLNVGSNLTVGAVFSGMKTECVCGCRAGSPFRPSLFISLPYILYFMGLRMLLLLYALFCCMDASFYIF